MEIDHLDHLVLTVADIARTVAFYEQVLGMEVITFGAGRKALKFGNQKINLHQKGRELDPKAAHPAPGTADMCFITRTPVALVLAELNALNIDILEGGIVSRTGAQGPILSVYFRDPDLNLIELSNYV
ncbi:VOC family virulence protein [Taibaiella sp. KBW10]|uniref:VOC family protein n=1 Tax=Taibaiella sp. KBW10 TaxID=2153357 RepID=UPI000F5B66C5|nr:VOC family protein [Taibaiella sp. KBW10]RQO29811.1 VOC family virulence protein [Taibaiella sp. KBW10]